MTFNLKVALDQTGQKLTLNFFFLSFFFSQVISSAPQDDMSDHSGDSAISYRDHLVMLENHNKYLETALSRNTEDTKRLTTQVEHLNRRVESLANQLRMIGFNGHGPEVTGLGSQTSSSSGSSIDHRSSPISVDKRPPAPLPGIERVYRASTR